MKVQGGRRSDSDSLSKRQADKLDAIKELRHLLGQYRTLDALLRQSRCLTLDVPGEQNLEALSSWFSQKTPLIGLSEHLLEDTSDLVCLKSLENSDRLSQMMRRHLGYWFKEPQNYPRSWGDNVAFFPDKRIERLVAVVSVLVSVALLVGSVVALFFVKRVGRRLGVMGVFTLLFAAFVGFLTNARRAELFAATAAYAAVLVVFVSGNFGT